MYRIEFTPEAIADLRSLQRRNQQHVVAQIELQLAHQPDDETRNRKRLRPNRLAEWELRVGKFRVFYDVDLPSAIVKNEAIGIKEGNRLFLRGEVFEL